MYEFYDFIYLNIFLLHFFFTYVSRWSYVFVFFLLSLLQIKLETRKIIKTKVLMESSQISQKKIFYDKARKQYEGAEKPFQYEINLNPTRPKDKKFMIIVNKFIQIFKQNMLTSYKLEDDNKNDCWCVLENQYSHTYEMGFIIENIYDRKIMKLRQYFTLLIHNKSIFSFLDQVIQRCSFMFENIQQKKTQQQNNIKLLDFLKDGKYKIVGDLINKYEVYNDERKQRQLIEAKAQQQAQKKRIAKELQAKKEQEERIKKQQEEHERQQRQRQIRQAKIKQMEQKSKLNHVDLYQPDFVPDQYIPRRQSSHQKIITKQRDLERNEQVIVPNRTKQSIMKHSQKLFQEVYKGQSEVFSFALKPQLSEDKQKCFSCQQKLSAGLYILGGNKNLCHYTGKWYCNEHIANQRMPIPWKAIESFDLRGYSVCQKALVELKSLYEKPIIQISNDVQIVRDHALLHNFLLIKRQIHLMYDAICNVEIIEQLFKKNLNYCLKINLFSLKNLYDIYNGQEEAKLQGYYELFAKHFYRCDICQKRKGYICPKCKDPVKIFPFEMKQCYPCKICKKLFHRRCLNGKCDCTENQ